MKWPFVPRWKYEEAQTLSGMWANTAYERMVEIMKLQDELANVKVALRQERAKTKKLKRGVPR